MDREERSPLEQPLPAPKPRRAGSLWSVWGLIAATTLVIGAGGALLVPAMSGDRVPADTLAKREALFATLAPIQIVPAADDDEKRLAGTMRLSDAERELLLKTLRDERVAASAAAKAPAPAPQASTAPAAPAARPATQAQPAAKPARPVTLTQITLWDTDAPDGDVVRIVSSGYETVVVLGKIPVILAVPVPPRGVINIVGEHDGGGGITVGVAVGGHAVELPIMSAGQTLGIPVLARP